jgi:SAM-dependent methyltransferase
MASTVRTWTKIRRLFTERETARRAINTRLTRWGRLLRNRLAIDTPLRTEDRRVLERIIFAHYASDPALETVLFVGCEWYTAHYGRRYFARHSYWTIDPDMNRRQFGARRHVVARLEELERYFPCNFFDLIICNGVYGWGLDRAEDVDAAMAQCHACLRDGGHLLFGWNDVPQRDPAPLSNVHGLARFSRYSFPAFGTWRYLITDTPDRHTYDFYQKRERLELKAPHSRR